MSAHYLTVTGTLPAAAEDALAGALEHWPVLGCQVENVGAEIDVTVFVAEAHAAAIGTVRAGLTALGARAVGGGRFAERDWLAEYRRHAVARPIGERFWIDPNPGAPTPPPAGRTHLLIEPRQAFGSGSHESTQLVLLMLEGLSVAGHRVLDVGTGSGILALAARALGAAEVVGFDIDLEAVCIARQTVAAQASPLAVTLFAGSAAALRPRPMFDLILANLIPAEAEPLLTDLHELLASGGTLLLSGLMTDQVAASEEELARCGFAVTGGRELEEWVGLVCTAGPGAQGAGHRTEPSRPAAAR